MWTDDNGNFTYGDCPPGWRAATDEEIAAYNLALQQKLRKAAIQETLSSIDSTAIHPMREILLAVVAGTTPDATQVSALQALHNQVAALNAELASLP